MSNPEDCTFFTHSPTSPQICGRWITPDSPGIKGLWTAEFRPFCAADLECEGKGRRTGPDAQLVDHVAALDRSFGED